MDDLSHVVVRKDNEPWCNVIDPGLVLKRSFPQTSHEASDAKFRRVVLGRARLVNVTSNAPLQNEACIGIMFLRTCALVLLAEMIQCQLGRVKYAFEVDGKYLQIGFFRSSFSIFV